jgi:integrase
MLSHDIKRYVDLKRTMGFKFRTQHSLLKLFGKFATERGDHIVLTQSAIDWAGLAPSPPQRHNRLATVRRFALAMHAEDPRYEVPPADVFGREWFKRRTPYIYTSEEVTRLMSAAGRLSPRNSIRAAAYSTLFGLLAATGLRASEALALEIEDLTDDGLLIRNTKFKKSRLVVLHATTRHALERYLIYRAKVSASTRALFVSTDGTALTYPRVNRIFLQLARSTGLRGGPGHPGPRLHQLRHTFAAKSLEQCGDSREEVARHMIALSTYLGHARASGTYWYLESTTGLMQHVARAAETLYTGESS